MKRPMRPPVTRQIRQSIGSTLLPPRVMNPEFPPGTPEWKKKFHFGMQAFGALAFVGMVVAGIGAIYQVTNAQEPRPN